MVVLYALDVASPEKDGPETRTRQNYRVGDELELWEKFVALLHRRQKEQTRTETVKDVIEQEKR